MNIYVLDVTYSASSTTFTPVMVIDSFKSLIWTKRYYTHGDFELYIPADIGLLNYLKPRNWLIRDNDDTVMLIENISIQTDVENGDYFIVSGRSLECVLGFRVVFPQVNVNSDDVIQGIKTIITSVTQDYRVFPSMTIDDSLTLSSRLSAQYTGDNLLDVVTGICQQYGIGIKINLSGSQIVLSFYQGNTVDVIFSQEFDNLINSNYVSNISNYMNLAYVAGEGEGSARKYVTTYLDTARNGFARRELFVDARDLSSNGGEITDAEYSWLLKYRGDEKLSEHQPTKAFEAEIEPSTTYTYKEDYDLGDIVTITNEYGITAHPRIVEIIESWDETGYTVVPTLEELEVE